MPPLTELQQRKVEENLGLVGQVIKERVHGVGQIGIFSYDDLCRIGTTGLCKAGQTQRPGKGAFSPYAYRISSNEIMTQLDYATLRRQRERATDPAELPCMTWDDGLEQTEACQDLLTLLEHAERTASGVTAKGIQAIRLLAQGYSNRDIGELYGVPSNYITAWVSKARKFILCRAKAAY